MIINYTDCGMLRFTDGEMEDRLRKETGTAPISPAKFHSFTDAVANTKEQIQRPRHIHGSRRRSQSGGSSMTSTPGGSARWSRTGRPSLVRQRLAILSETNYGPSRGGKRRGAAPDHIMCWSEAASRGGGRCWVRTNVG
jgi:hypothetical protein